MQRRQVVCMRQATVRSAAIRVALLLVVGRLVAQPSGVELPPLADQPSENVSLIANGGFEDPESPAWVLSDWPPRPDTGARLIAESITYSEDQVRSGQRSLRIDLSTVEEDRHLLAQQRFSREALAPFEGRRVRMSAWAWLERGPPGFQASLSIRQWGQPGAAPVSHGRLWLPTVQAEWVEGSREFTLQLGETTRGDITVDARQVADLATSPVIYVDDVRLEVLAEPPLTAELLRGETLLSPDTVLPVKVELSDQALADGLRHLRWNVTSPDGLRGLAEGDVQLASATRVLDLVVPDLPEGRYAVRLAIGRERGGRDAETLLPFRRGRGPFAR